MKTSTKWLVALIAIFVVGGLLILLAALSLLPMSRVVEPQPAPTPEPVAAIADGTWFGFVTVGKDESGAITLGVDLAEMLSGEEAHAAAVEAGVITEDQDLPNDFFIRNTESVLELMHLADTAVIEVISAADVATVVTVSPEELRELYEGGYPGSDVYGIVPGQPIAMDVTVEDGMITELKAVYLP